MLVQHLSFFVTMEASYELLKAERSQFRTHQAVIGRPPQRLQFHCIAVLKNHECSNFLPTQRNTWSIIKLINRKKSLQEISHSEPLPAGTPTWTPPQISFWIQKISYNSITKSHQTSFVRVFFMPGNQLQEQSPFSTPSPGARVSNPTVPSPPNLSSNTIIDLSCTWRLRGKGVALGVGEDQRIHVVFLSTTLVTGAGSWEANSTE